MAPSSAGAIVMVPFPFSDLTQTKLRPAVVVAGTERGDWILCQITSNPYADTRAVALTARHFAEGGLRVTSYAWPGKLFTANQNLVVSEVGVLSAEAFARVVQAVTAVVQSAFAAGAAKPPPA